MFLKNYTYLDDVLTEYSKQDELVSSCFFAFSAGFTQMHKCMTIQIIGYPIVFLKNPGVNRNGPAKGGKVSRPDFFAAVILYAIHHELTEEKGLAV